MQTRLTNACWGIPEFQSALSAPSPYLSTFINQLKMAVSNYHAIKKEPISTYIAESYLEDNEKSPEVNFTNRRFKDNYRSRGGSRSGYRHKELLGTSRESPHDVTGSGKNKQGLFNFGNKCYVCGQEDFRVRKHNKDQRHNTRKRLESRSHTYITESLDAQDVEDENEATNLYIAEAFSDMNFDCDA
ncbi:hypothetical protein GcC1_048033 [Golovinomyces cichoracearum]|uniref:Uncharacterized protein n=1 Tax=Golovinomyces cichoracearum TaxID=62708 RepID=A0A420IXH2_9PEZI|nr:hypothetical protein GcC1_048033 [Golovinomyces cichoracearum]